MQALLAAGQPAKARRVLRSVVQNAEADPLSLLLAAKVAVAAGGDAVPDGVALARCRAGCHGSAMCLLLEPRRHPSVQVQSSKARRKTPPDSANPALDEGSHRA